MALSSLRERGGFWVPDEFLSLALPRVKPVGLAIYCVLAHCESPRDYPSPEGLAGICLTTVNKVENILDVLLDLGFLNYNDVVSIRSKKK